MPKKSPHKKKDSIPDKLRLLMQTPDFEEMIEESRKHLGINDSGLANFKDLDNYLDKASQDILDTSISKYKNFLGATEIIMRCFRIPEYYEHFIMFYLLMDREFPSLIEKNRIIIQKKKDKYGHPVINIQITANVRKQELESRWTEVTRLQKEIGVNKYTKPLDNIERDAKLLELKKQKLSTTEIHKKINQEFPEGQLTEVTHVSARITRIRRLLEHLT